MKDHKKAPKNQERLNQEHSSRKNEAEPLSDQFHESGKDALLVGETPFRPPEERHAALLARAHSADQRANTVMQLQQTYGNAYVQRLLSSLAIQTTLTVNAPNDVYEQEADRIADAVTGTADTQITRQPQEEEEE